MTSERFGGVCAVLVGALFIAGLAFLDLPGHDDGEARLNEFYGDSGNRVRVLLGAFSWALAGIALLGLGAVLTSRAERGGASAVLTRLMLMACAVSAVLLMGAGAAQVPTYALSIDAFDEPESELTRATIPHIGYSLLLFSMLGAAAFIASVAAAIRGTAMLPAWTGWLGFSAAGLLVLSIIFMPMFALPVWAVAMGVVLLRAPAVVGPRPGVVLST
ncbi:MAG: hypothetical protein WD557_02120 [Dehalococcoidia bacterium]